MYTADIPEPSAGCFNLIFADDNKQIVTYPGKSKNMLALKTQREIIKMNSYEKEWKIQTNKNKFQLVSISSTKPSNIEIDGQILPFNRKATILGLTINTHGIRPHINSRLGKAKSQLKKLKRFKNLQTDTRLRLYKTLIRPILEYPPIPLCVASKTNQQKIQRVQNVAIRAAAKERPGDPRSTNEQLHNVYNIEAINIRIHNQAQKIWTKLESININLIDQANVLTEEIARDHSWWPSVSRYLKQDPPESLYL